MSDGAKGFLHLNARRERHASYPERFPVPDEKVPWDVPFPEYAPPYFVDPIVLANDRTKNRRGWAEPEDIPNERRTFRSYEGEVRLDPRGVPLNPRGRTGLAGRGTLGLWGANFAADPLVTRIGERSGALELLAIRRKDSGEWAIPGGMVDVGEEVSRTLEREFREEAGVDIDMSGAFEVYRGYVDDRRNTDNAWMETVVKHLHVVPPLAATLHPRGGDDAGAARWTPLTPRFLDSLWAGHGTFVRRALMLALERGAPAELVARRLDLTRLLPG